ncbi:hypothetical protein [Sanguibacter sp. 25GB23B1]|uniref:hypothetical protein n=1 Tax=unclassified Sanguibacter TaxID=2645534 RepID=UPI0032AE8B86
MSHFLPRVAVLTVAALALAGCSQAAVPEPDTTGTAAPSAPDADTLTRQEPTFAATSLPDGLMLSGAAFGADGVAPVVNETIDAWALPGPCAAGAPSTALASREVAYSDDAVEPTIATQQLAVFADASVAVTEAKRLADVMAACAAASVEGTFVVEDVRVGAQGRGLVVSYDGAVASGRGDDAPGYYLVTTRRGNAVTLVGHLGGTASVGESRTSAVKDAQAAWRLLCVYDSAGC